MWGTLTLLRLSSCEEPLGTVMPLCSPGRDHSPLWHGPPGNGHGPLRIVIGAFVVGCHVLEVSRSYSLGLGMIVSIHRWSRCPFGWCVLWPGFVATRCWSVFVPCRDGGFC